MCLLAFLVLACGRQGPATAGAGAAFTDEGATQQSGYEGREPKVEIRGSGDRWLLTAFQGSKPTGGYQIRVERATQVGMTLRVHARFTEPPAEGIVTQVLTSPAHTIGIAFRPDEIVLVDQDDRERARTRP